MARRKNMSQSTEILASGENAMARTQEVISQARAEIERSQRLVKLIRSTRKKKKPFNKTDAKK